MRQDKNSPDTFKSLLILSLLVLLFSASSVTLTSFPQHLLLDNKTVLSSTIGFMDNGKVNIKGNQVSYGTNDVITISGRDYVRITGNQISLGNQKLPEGIRIVTPSSILQNPLFEQQVGTFDINRAAQLIIDSNTIAFISVSQAVIKIQTKNDNYNLQFTGSTYLTYKDQMIHLSKSGNKVSVSIVGLKNYDKIAFRVI